MHRKASMLCMLAALLSFGSAAFAQEQTVSIQGVVKDASGAVLPGATVEARNPLAGTNTAVTNADGVYRFPALPPGKYEITSTLQGFKPAKLTDTVLELGKNLVIDLTMALASVTEEVSVTAESSPIIDVKRQRRHRVDSPAAPSSACRRGATSRRSCVRRRAPRRVEVRRHPDRRRVRLREPLRHRRHGHHQPADRRLGQDDAARLRRRSAGQVVRLQRRVRRRHRRRRQRVDQVGHQRSSTARWARTTRPRTCTAASGRRRGSTRSTPISQRRA